MTRTKEAVNADLRDCAAIWLEHAQKLRTAGEEEKALSAEATARKFEARIVVSAGRADQLPANQEN